MNSESANEQTPQPASAEQIPPTKQARPEADSKRQKTQPPEAARQSGASSKEPSASWFGWSVLCGTLALALIVTVLAVSRSVVNPCTDDAEVFANFFGMAPQVEGPIVELPIRDNQYVKAGELLLVIDERPYRYALERAISQRAALEGQIEDQKRHIRSQVSGIHVAPGRRKEQCLQPRCHDCDYY